MLEEAGFEDGERVEWTGYDTSAETLGASFRAATRRLRVNRRSTGLPPIVRS